MFVWLLFAPWIFHRAEFGVEVKESEYQYKVMGHTYLIEKKDVSYYS